jgi:pSer/pThr/pTyr-binding forkhead associated (FHA) protein
MEVPVVSLSAESGPLAANRYHVSCSPFTIGRSEDNDLVVPETAVSRHHARLEQQGESWVIHDCGSSNGVFLNGERLVSPQPLCGGDVIGIGGSRFVFEGPSAAPAAQGVPGALPPKARRRGSRSRIVIAIVLGLVLVGLLTAVALVLSRGSEEETPAPGLPGIELPTLVLPTGLPELPTVVLPTGMPSLEIPTGIPSGLPIPTGLPPLPTLGLPQTAQRAP